MHCPIINSSVTTQQMPNTKASHGGEKIIVKMTVDRDCYLHNRAEIRIVFHHDMVFVTEIRYMSTFVKDGFCRGHYEKSNFSKPIKNAYPFNMFVHGYTYDGHGLDPIAMADLALKMYRNQYIYFSPNGNKYLMDI
jgi:hypothetical protein